MFLLQAVKTEAYGYRAIYVCQLLIFASDLPKTKITGRINQCGCFHPADIYARLWVGLNKLYEMHLTVMAKVFKDQLTDPNISKLSFEDRFGLLVDQE